MYIEKNNRAVAQQHFEEARRKATIEKISYTLTGRNYHNIPFEAIRGELRQQNPFYRGIQNVNLEAIVGSVGRYKEFTRHFLPLTDSLGERWINIETMAKNLGWLPIELYKIGEVYFVKDGNHRVSVARHLESPTIEAHIWEYPVSIKIHPDDDFEQAIINLGEHNFLEKTELDQLYPNHNIQFTTPGRYSELLSQIADTRQRIFQQSDSVPSEQEVVTVWYNSIYLPTITVIHNANLLKSFPGRTEADLFVWLSKHRERLGQKYGDYESLVELAKFLAKHYKENKLKKASRQMRRLLGHNELPELIEEEKP